MTLGLVNEVDALRPGHLSSFRAPSTQRAAHGFDGRGFVIGGVDVCAGDDEGEGGGEAGAGASEDFEGRPRWVVLRTRRQVLVLDGAST